MLGSPPLDRISTVRVMTQLRSAAADSVASRSLHAPPAGLLAGTHGPHYTTRRRRDDFASRNNRRGLLRVYQTRKYVRESYGQNSSGMMSRTKTHAQSTTARQ